MAETKMTFIEALGYFKGKIDTIIENGDALAYKAYAVEDNALKLYRTEDKSDTPDVIDFPAEMYLDQTKTTLVNNFTWSDTSYPDSVNPNLDGEPVLVMAVKGDSATTYSFLSMKSLIDVYTGVDTATANTSVSADNKISVVVKTSAEEGNTLILKSDGLYVPKLDATDMTFATASEIDALFV